MTKHKDTHDIWNGLRQDPHDFDLQAGARGLSLAQAAARYLKFPGHFLAILRLFREETLEEVAKGAGIPAADLASYEKGTRIPPLKDLVALAKHHGAHLRVFLEIFGHVEEGASDNSMGIAAQFGAELSDTDKLNLRELVKMYSREKKDS